ELQCRELRQWQPRLVRAGGRSGAHRSGRVSAAAGEGQAVPGAGLRRCLHPADDPHVDPLHHRSLTVPMSTHATAAGAAATAPWNDPQARAYVSIEKVTKRFDDFTAVNDVSLKIYQGELFCLLGASG